MKNNLKQAFYIGSGFLLGQGSMFAVQTYLVAQQQFSLISAVGIFLGILTLFQGVADGGGIFLLSKYRSENLQNQYFYAFLLARVLFTSFFLALLYLISFFVTYEHWKFLLIFVAVNSFIWVFNINGILDFEKLNKKLIYTSSINWLIASIILYFFDKNQKIIELIGFGFSFGTLINVISQYLIVRKINISLFQVNPTYKNVEMQLKVICAHGFGYIAAQGYGRLLPIFTNYYLSSTLAGYCIYAKSLASAIGQLVIFTRRADYGRLVELVNKEEWNIKSILKVQQVGIYISFVAFLISIFFYLLFTINNSNIVIANMCLGMIFLNILWSMVHAVSMSIVALGMNSGYSFSIVASSIVGILLLMLLLRFNNLYYILIIELIVYLFQIIISLYFLKLAKMKNG